MKKLIIASLFIATSCFANELKLYTGHITGLYNSIGHELCDVLNCSTEISKGSIDNINKLNQNPNSLAIVQSDSLEKFINQVNVIKTLYNEPYTIVVRANSDIKSFTDLKGKIVNTAKDSSGSYLAIENLLSIYKMNFSDFKKTDQFTTNSQGRALCQEKIDAFIYVMGHPNLNLQVAAEECDLKFVPIDDKLSKDFVAQHTAFTLGEIKADIYPFNHTSTKTIAVKAILVASKKMDITLLNQLKAKLKESYNNLQSRNFGLNGINLED